MVYIMHKNIRFEITAQEFFHAIGGKLTYDECLRLLYHIFQTNNIDNILSSFTYSNKKTYILDEELFDELFKLFLEKMVLIGNSKTEEQFLFPVIRKKELPFLDYDFDIREVINVDDLTYNFLYRVKTEPINLEIEMLNGMIPPVEYHTKCFDFYPWHYPEQYVVVYELEKLKTYPSLSIDMGKVKYQKLPYLSRNGLLSRSKKRNKTIEYTNVAEEFLNFGLIQRFGLCVAGGAALSMHNKNEKYTDIDLFFCNSQTEEEMKEIIFEIAKFLTKIQGFERQFRIYQNSFSFGIYKDKKITIVLRSYVSVEQVIDGFDVDGCGIAIVPLNDTYEFVTSNRFNLADTNSMLIVNFEKLSPSYESRIYKYMTRGFDLFIPCASIVNKLLFINGNIKKEGLYKLLNSYVKGNLTCPSDYTSFMYNTLDNVLNYNQFLKKMEDVTFKFANPGEQSIGTFNRIVIENCFKWLFPEMENEETLEDLMPKTGKIYEQGYNNYLLVKNLIQLNDIMKNSKITVSKRIKYVSKILKEQSINPKSVKNNKNLNDKTGGRNFFYYDKLEHKFPELKPYQGNVVHDFCSIIDGWFNENSDKYLLCGDYARYKISPDNFRRNTLEICLKRFVDDNEIYRDLEKLGNLLMVFDFDAFSIFDKSKKERLNKNHIFDGSQFKDIIFTFIDYYEYKNGKMVKVKSNFNAYAVYSNIQEKFVPKVRLFPNAESFLKSDALDFNKLCYDYENETIYTTEYYLRCLYGRYHCTPCNYMSHYNSSEYNVQVIYGNSGYGFKTEEIEFVS